MKTYRVVSEIKCKWYEEDEMEEGQLQGRENVDEVRGTCTSSKVDMMKEGLLLEQEKVYEVRPA